MNGLHLCAEWHDCEGERALALLRDPDGLRQASLAATRAAGLTVVGDLFHAFPAPGGVTGVVLLAESHLALHTWPELAGVTLDVYVCNRSGDHSRQARQLLDTLRLLLRPVRAEEREIMRGALGPQLAAPPAIPA